MAPQPPTELAAQNLDWVHSEQYTLEQSEQKICADRTRAV